MNRKQLTVFLILLLANAFGAFATYAFFIDDVAATAGIPMPQMPVSNAVLGLANAGIVIVLYGIVGWAGIWFARKLDLPGVYSEDGNWNRWFFIPLLLGLLCGVVFIVGDILFAPINNYGRIVHPTFPSSIFASISAGSGEEMMFRGFVFGLWGLLLNWLFKRLNGILGLIAGQRYMKDGLVAAAGIHFWTDVVFHVIWGLF